MPTSVKKWTIWLLGTDNFYDSDSDSLINESVLIGGEATIDDVLWLPLYPLAVDDDKLPVGDDMIAQYLEYNIPLAKLFINDSADMTYLQQLQDVLSARYLYLSSRGTGQDSATYYPLTLHPSGKFIHIRKNGSPSNERNYTEASVNRTMKFKRFKETY